ncbi:MAG: hypothetical protein KBG84_11860 [Planctomycetes bacterium]|nr:hypothetical protein [Planctomycetota bacterium]
MAEQVEIRCPSCQSLFTVSWVQGNYAAVCMNCGKGIADLRPYLTQSPPADASTSSRVIAGSALTQAQAPVNKQTEVLADLVRETLPQNADGNAPTVFGAKPVSDTKEPAPASAPSIPASTAEAETMKMPKDVASQPTKALPRRSLEQQDPAASTSFGTSKLKLGRVGHSLTGETKIRRRERLERGKKKIFESWVAPAGALSPAGNSGHFAPPTASASKTRSISYRDLRSSSSTAYLDSLRSAAEAARVKKGISKRLMPQLGSNNEVVELEKFLEEAQRQESARQSQVASASSSATAEGTLSDLTFPTNIPKEVVVQRDSTPDSIEESLPVEPADPLQLPKPASEGSLPPAALAAAAQAAAVVASRDEKSSAHANVLRKSVAEIQEENDPGERRVATRSIIAKETEIKLKSPPPPRFAVSGYTVFMVAMYLLMFLGVVAFALMIVNQYLTDLGLPRIK